MLKKRIALFLCMALIFSLFSEGTLVFAEEGLMPEPSEQAAVSVETADPADGPETSEASEELPSEVPEQSAAYDPETVEESEPAEPEVPDVPAVLPELPEPAELRDEAPISDEGNAKLMAESDFVYTTNYPVGNVFIESGSDVTLIITTDQNVQFKWYICTPSGGYHGYQATFTGNTTNTYTAEDLSGGEHIRCDIRDADGNYLKILDWFFCIENGFTLTANQTGEIEVAPGTPLMLSVTADATDADGITYAWYITRRDVYDGKIYNLNCSEPVLAETINNGYSHYWIYCTARDKFGTELEVMFDVYVQNHLYAYPAGNDRYSNSTQILVPYGGTADLTVVAEADNMDSITYTWAMESPEVWPSDPERDIHKPTLTTDPITKAVRYYCTVKDGYGASSTASFYMSVENHLTVTIDGAVYSDGHWSAYGKYGKPLTLRAVVTADDMTGVTYNWIPYGGELSSTGNNTAELTILELTQRMMVILQVADKYGTVLTFPIDLLIDNGLSAFVKGTQETTKWVFLNDGDPLDAAVDFTVDDPESVSFGWYDYRGTPIDSVAGDPFSIHLEDPSDGAYRFVAGDQYGNYVMVLFIVSHGEPFALSDEELHLEIGETAVLSVSGGLPEGVGQPLPMFWISEDPSIASVDENGTVTAMKNGITEIHVTPEQIGGWIGTCRVFVGDVTEEGRLIDHELTVAVPDTKQIAHEGLDGATWTSDHPEIVSVAEDGTVTALRPGTAVITVVSRYGTIEDSCTVTALFQDVQDPDTYFFTPVYWAVDQGITTGYTVAGGALTGFFGPEDTCTRGQIVTFLWRANGSPEVSASDAPKFKDVKKSAYYYKAVLWAAVNGITTGYTDSKGKPTGKFGPEDTCTRGQIVTFLWRSEGSPEADASAAPKFKDVKKTDYFYKAVIWAAVNNITTGVSKTKFAPNADCTRAMVVTFLYRTR